MRTGLWIPVEIEVLPLNLTEKVLLAEIVSLDRVGECFASNEHFSKLIGIRSDSVSRIISKLKKMGLVKQTGFDGRRRKLIPILESKSVQKEDTILSKVLYSAPKQNSPKTKSRIGESAEAAFAISNDPIKRVQIKQNVQKSWDEFLKWSRERLSPSTWDLVSKASRPEDLKGSAFLMWKNWAPL
ncbi:helix-turn-helix domain-containing protein [Leptospira levettii]|uniref:helix-turn-helix domain-containing protein n=1 Tax=Leptospira levettii TaxID=2023178 RepID=UPI0038F64DD7